ncbi:MAG: hypothetical protein JXQ96_03800 [Cyclobacteriaceae bacterium]
MNTQAIESELLESLRTLNDNQRSDVLSFIRKISSQNLMQSVNRKKALREIRAALRSKRS